MLMSTQNISHQSFPLAMSTVGERVRVESVEGGKNLTKRLLAMGICDGVELEVVQRHHGAGVVVRCADTRWGIGEGMAHKVLVSSIKEYDTGDE